MRSRSCVGGREGRREKRFWRLGPLSVAALAGCILARWREFLEWTRDSASGFQRAFLLRGKSDARHFVSFSTWDDAASEEQWRTLPEFMQKFGACRALCDDMTSDNYQREMTIS